MRTTCAAGRAGGAASREESAIDTHQKTQQVISHLLDKKARDITIIDMSGRVSYCDCLILCNGTSARQVRSLAESLLRSLKTEHGIRPLGVEGVESGRWVLVDLGDIVLHVFDESSRKHFDLDGLWVDAPRIALASLGLSDAPPVEAAPAM